MGKWGKGGMKKTHKAKEEESNMMELINFGKFDLLMVSLWKGGFLMKKGHVKEEGTRKKGSIVGSRGHIGRIFD